MRFLHKRHLIGLFLLIYSLSYFLQSWFFVDFGKVFAENTLDRTHLVAVFVDKNIYPEVKNDIEWYTTEYLQQRISNSKALVLPINVENFKAIDISKMLENMYFDGIKDKTSDLLGAIFVGNIPLPVVQNNGFIYPSIFPYVDFEEQQFIYDANQQFFVYNNNPNGQAEIWHGLLNFGSESQKYSDFFDKLKTYVASPQDFVSPLLWYDDFIGMKTTFSQDILPYYINNFLFTEDIGYHRFTNTLLDYFKQQQSEDMDKLIGSLADAATNNPQLAEVMSQGGGSFDALGSSHVPTAMLITVIKELLKSYENLYPGVFLSTMRDNVETASRWYKQTGSGQRVDGIDSHIHKIALKDSLSLGSLSNSISPLMISYNDAMEEALDNQIEDNKWYMTFPIIAKYVHEDWENKKQRIPPRVGPAKRWCEKVVDDVYKNYYFGTYAAYISSAQEFSAYRGTFRNLETFSGTLVSDKNYHSFTGTSLGASYGLFATQVEANRGYNIMSAAGDYDTYDENKTKTHRKIECGRYFKILGIKIFCMTKTSSYVGDEQESLQDFALRGWGGASSINLDSDLMAGSPPKYEFIQYDPKSAIFPIYDIAGSKALEKESEKADSFLGSTEYSSVIKTKDRYGLLEYPKYIKGDTDNYPSDVYDAPGDGGYRALIGTKKITRQISDFDYFKVWNQTNDKGSKKRKKIYVEGNLKEDKSSSDIGGKKCGGKRETYTYTYNIIDSRVKNTAPTPDQVNGTYESQFSEDGLFWQHYTYLQDSLDSLKSASVSSFSPVESGLQLLLSGVQEVNSGILSFVDLSSTDSGVLLSGIDSLLSLTGLSGQDLYSGVALDVFLGLQKISDEIPLLNFGLTLGYFARIDEVEDLFNQETVFLSGWSNDLLSTLSSIESSYRKLPTKYQSIVGLYTSLKETPFLLDKLYDKKSDINDLKSCGTTPATYSCGCESTYQDVCLKIDSLVDSLTNLRQQFSYIEYYSEPDEIDGETVTIEVKPLESILTTLNEAGEEGGFLLDLLLVRSKISSIETVDKDSPVYKEGLNQTTLDRPIDSPRKITFKGLGGDLVTFVYPNLYEVKVYKEEGSTLILKSIEEIELSIESYLVDKAKEYNGLLSNQEKKRNVLYDNQKSAYDFLAESDPLASPKDRTTSYIPDTYFVDLIGEDSIYELAELLYYQTLPVYVKKSEQYVDQELNAIRSAFDINKKIDYVFSGYLTQHPDQGSVITPAYNSSGYEVAYINSDRSDYISASEVPAFILQIQKQQKPVSNAFVEESTPINDSMYEQTNRQCSIDSSYSELLFDLKEEEGKGKMPWITALQCWRETIPTATRFELSLEVGPSFGEFLSGLQSSFDEWKSSMNQFLGREEKPGAEFSGDLGEYWTNIIMITGDNISAPQIETADIILPTQKLLAGSQMPVAVSAKDFSGNNLDRTIDSYYVYVMTGDGDFIGAGYLSPNSEEFSDFANTTLLYQAPNVTQATTVTFTLTGKDVTATQELLVTPGDITIASDSVLYDKNKLLKKLSFSLSGIDSTFSTVPYLLISLEDKNEQHIDTPFSILSKNGLVKPGIISSGNFVGSNTFFLEKKEQKIFLMPTYRVGEDELWIQIPGKDPIVIPISVYPGSPYHVSLSTSSNLVTIGDTFSGSLLVTDARGNPISESVNLEIGSYGALDFSKKTVTVSSDSYDFSSATLEPGGVSYLFAYLKDIPMAQQSPAYQKVIVQESFLPEEKLNIMYLNLFGSDWGNLWETNLNSSYVPDLISNSNKLLAVTTQIQDPSLLKKFVTVVSEKGQIHNLVDNDISLQLLSGNLVADIFDVGYISLGLSKNVVLFSSETPLDTLENLSSRIPTSFVFKKSDSLQINDFEITDTSFSYSGVMLFDLENDIWNTGLVISQDEKMDHGYSVWSVFYDDIFLGSAYIVTQSLQDSAVKIYNHLLYDTKNTFAEGTTNGQKGIGIIDLMGTFEKQGYLSIEDSENYEEGIGFRSDFKNITLFGDGKTVGESTIPFGSQFLINFGDPLLSRISDNPENTKLNLDLGIGKQIYSNPSKPIFKVLHTDFNNDTLEDVLVVFTDGSVKLLKNYGGTTPYTNMQDLLRLADSIKDIYVGDVDANNYPDLLVRTNSNQLRVYKNDKGVLDVDGNIICLNINADGTKINDNPESVAGLQQVFFEDMDRDGSLDIITNDSIGDIKIFYGGSKNGQGHYVSTLGYACDDNWYDRQKDSTKLIKSFGVIIDSDYYVQDESMIHVKGWDIITQTEDPLADDSSTPDVDLPMSIDPNSSDFSLKSMVAGMANLSQELAYESLNNQLSVAPLGYVPNYETDKDLKEIGYRKLIQLSGNDTISVYKKYKDVNGGILISGDIVTITTTILGLQNNIQATYFDRLTGPWKIPTDENNRITSFEKKSGSFTEDDITWLDSDQALFVLDNIDLDTRQSLTFSYDVVYFGEPTVSIDIKDVLYPDQNKEQDTYLDVVVYPLDSCKKYRWIFFNTPSQNHRSYEEVFDNIQAKLDAYYQQQIDSQGDNPFTETLPETLSEDSGDNDSASDVLGIMEDIMAGSVGEIQNVFESWTVSDLFSSTSEAHMEFNMDALDTLMAPVSDGIDKMLDGLCQGFKLGAKSGCQPPFPFNMIPFNQAFLAPGKYHIFGCTPTVPNPLAPLFMTINNKFGGGFPILFFPGTLQTPVGPIPMIGSSFVPIVQQMPGSDGFGLSPALPPTGGTYPSQVRLYLVPTLTMQMGVAMCFGPYKLGTNIPPLFRDLAGNCVVVAFPLYKCNGDDSPTDEVPTEELDPWMTDAAQNGTCDKPTQTSSAKVVSNTLIVQQTTYSSAFKLSSLGAQSSSWTSAVPQGNFGGFGYVSFSSKPMKISPSNHNTPSSLGGEFGFGSLNLFKGPTIDLKIKDSNSQGIIAVLVKDWFGRQIKYMINNLTKMTITVTLPDVSQLADGFDSLFSAVSWSDANEAAKEDDYNLNLSGLSGSGKFAAIASKQMYQDISSSVNNPFESLITMFQSVPLMDLYTKDVVLKIPLPTSDELRKYKSYLRGWLDKQQKILKKWLEAIHEVASICGSMTPAQAKVDLADLDEEETLIGNMQSQGQITTAQRELLKQTIIKERDFLKKVIDGEVVTQSTSLVTDVKAVFSDIGRQFGFFAKKVVSLPRLKWTQQYLKYNLTSPTDQEKAMLVRIDKRVDSLSTCAVFSTSIDGFSSFYSQATALVRDVQQNLQVLDQYQKFPLELYDWIHFVDKYMGDILNFVSVLSSTLIGWINVNARIYAKWVQALIVILSTIKSYQIIIDLSVNWAKKCGKCSSDGYGAHGCSLSFLFPKIPIIPIPAFKIPNINIDLSHIDLGISMALPRFVFSPIDLPLPKLPDLPSPPDFNLGAGLDFSITFDLNLPEIPILPAPPSLPELPSFIPKIDFSLPTLPPAPRIPELVPEISAVLDVAEIVAQIFCILKQGVGLVGEKGVKAKVEQLTQRTWDVPFFDFFDQTFTWQADKPLQGFDLQLDGFLQFKMDFDGFFDFLNQISEFTNQLSSSVTNVYSKGIDNLNSGLNNNKVMDFLNKDIDDIDLDFTAPSLDIDIDPLGSTVDYNIAYQKLSDGLRLMKDRVDDPTVKDDIEKVTRVLNTPIVIEPATKEIETIQKEVQNILLEKQKEVRKLADSMKSYDTFLAQLKRNDIALVNDEHIEVSYSTPLFTTNKETYALLDGQESPVKAYMDTNAKLVNGYLQTLTSSTPEELSMSKTDYQKSTTYLQGLQSKIEHVYDDLGFEKISYSSCGVPSVVSDDVSSLSSRQLLAQSCPTCGGSSSSPGNSMDISSYVRGVFVEDPTSGTMINVVKSDDYISKVRDNYIITDINQDQQQDVILWDVNSIYIKYAKQESEHKNLDTYDDYYDYSPGFFGSFYIDSYDDLLHSIADDDGYVDFGDISVKLASPVQEIKNFRMVGQSFDAIQMSWMAHSDLGESVDGYLIKLNHRVDTNNDKDNNFRFLDDKFLNKRYVLMLPNDTEYTGSYIDFKERYYYKGKDADKARDIIEFLSGGTYSELIYAVKFYDPNQPVIALGLNEIPRNWQYAEITSLKNVGTEKNPSYVPNAPWSNQIVAGRQIISDTIGPEAEITLQRPSIEETLSTGTRHKGFVGTYYTLNIDWEDNVAISDMWIQQGTTVISSLSGDQAKETIQLTGLYFTGEESLEYLVGAEDFNGNRQIEKVTLDIGIPEISIKDFVPLSDSSGQLVAELSHDIDEGMVVFQRQRNDIWQEIAGSLANSYGGYTVGPRQTIVTGSVFSLGNTIGLFDNYGTEIGQLSVDGNITIFPEYQDIYSVLLELTTGYPLIRILNKRTNTTVFWMQMPSSTLTDLTLYQKEPFYSSVSIDQPSFGVFMGGYCVQSIDKECVFYVSPKGQVYIPSYSSTSLLGEYRYDTTTRSVIYVIKDFLGKDIARVTMKVNLFK